MNAPSSRRRPIEPVPRRSGGFAEFTSEHRAGLLAITVAAAAAAGIWILWDRYGPGVQADRDNLLLPEDVELSGVGDWIRGDLKAEALRDASLENGVPLDDPELARRLARAFDIHPWVREVVGVTLRHPAGAAVEVRCREPVAMVSVPGGLLAVDAEGVVLPSDDFTPQAAARYPRITGITSGPRGAVGFTWGDPLVEEGAAVAAVIGPEWERLELGDCRPVPRTGGGSDWEFAGAGDMVIKFGSAPGHEQPGEPTAAVKVARLRELASGPRPSGTLDLAAETAPVRPLIPAP